MKTTLKIVGMFCLFAVASTFGATVTTLLDDGPGSLRAALAVGGNIDFAVSGVITLTSGELVINPPMTILGPGPDQLTVERSAVPNTPEFRILHVRGNSGVLVSGLTIRGGSVATNYSGGAGILNEGFLTLSNCVVTGNRCTGDTGRGAGLYSVENGSVSAQRCVFTNNQCIGLFSQGGGVYASGKGTFIECMVNGNSTVDRGGGVYVNGDVSFERSTLALNWVLGPLGQGGAIYTAGTLTLVNSTLSGNSASGGGGAIQSDEISRGVTIGNCTISGNSCLIGAAIQHNGVVGTPTPGNDLRVNDSIIAGNTVIDIQSNGSLVSGGYNLFGTVYGNLLPLVPTDQLGWISEELRLGRLTNNGGFASTRALFAGSPAIDAGTPARFVAIDERGVARPFGSRPDIGAFELNQPASQLPPNLAPVAKAQSLTGVQGSPLAITLQGFDPDGDPLTYHVGHPSLGVLTGTPPNLVFVPPSTYYADTINLQFDYTVSDGLAESTSVTVLISLPPLSPTNSIAATTLRILDSQASEILNANGTTNTGSFAVIRTGNTNNSIRFGLTVGGTAAYGTDYTTVPELNVISTAPLATYFDMPAGATSVVFTIYPRPDLLVEGTEGANFTLVSNGSYTIGTPNQVFISILDAPPPPTSRIFFPSNGAVFASLLNVETRSSVSNQMKANVRLYADDRVISSTNGLADGSEFTTVTNFAIGNHTLYVASSNNSGLALASTSAPVRIAVLTTRTEDPTSPFLGLAPHSDASFVIDANGALFDWGNGGNGATGDGGSTAPESRTVPLPIQIPLTAGTNRWLKTAAGLRHTLGLTASGKLFAWGDNRTGQSGNGVSLTSEPLPVLVPAGVEGWRDIAAGYLHSLGIAKDGRLFSWGYNLYGQLGIGAATNSSSPTLIGFPQGVSSWQAVAAGAYYSMALGNDGNLYAWGQGADGPLGTGTAGVTNTLTPRRVIPPANVSNWIRIATGRNHTLAIAGNGRLYAWGSGSFGKIGNGGSTNVYSPTPVVVPTGVTNWVAIAAGADHSLAIASDGRLFSWGYNIYGQLGRSSFTNVLVPSLVSLAPGAISTWKWVSAGANHTLAIARDCMVYSWGNNSRGQLGDPNANIRTAPGLVKNLGDLCSLPVVRILSPTNGARFPSPAVILVRVSAVSHDGQIRAVSIQTNGVLLGFVNSAPYEFLWAGIPPGNYALTAVTSDNISPLTSITSAPVNISVDFVNRAPSFTGGPDQVVAEDSGPQAVAGWARNITPGPPTEKGQLVSFILTNNNPGLFSEQPALTPSRLTFTPAPNANGSATVTVILKDNAGTANGGSDTSAPQTFVITVTPVNDAPVARPQVVFVEEDEPVSIVLSATDVDNDALSFQIVTPPAHGSLSGDPPNVVYRGFTNYNGPDNFTFKANDGRLDSDPATVSIVVAAVNDTPIAATTIGPLIVISAADTNLYVLSPNGVNASVVLDGSQSDDVESSSLLFAWHDGTNQIASSAVSTNLFGIGPHAVLLTVSDGQATGRAQVDFEVITAGTAVGQLLVKVDEAELGQKNQQPLIATLSAAMASFDRGNIRAGLNQLGTFQIKVRAQVAPVNPALAEEFLTAAQRIIDAMSEP